MEEKVNEIINIVLHNSGKNNPDIIKPENHLRNDLGFDSMMLAELTVHIEEEFNVDIFEDGLVNNVEEIYTKLRK